MEVTKNDTQTSAWFNPRTLDSLNNDSSIFLTSRHMSIRIKQKSRRPDKKQNLSILLLYTIYIELHGWQCSPCAKVNTNVVCQQATAGFRVTHTHNPLISRMLQKHCLTDRNSRDRSSSLKTVVSSLEWNVERTEGKQESTEARKRQEAGKKGRWVREQRYFGSLF